MLCIFKERRLGVVVLLVFAVAVSMVTLSCTSKSPTGPTMPPKDWIVGELVAGLDGNITDEALDEFVLLYEEWDLKIISHAKSKNYIRFFFDHEKIDVQEFMSMLKNNLRLKWVYYHGLNLLWRSGFIFVILQSPDYFEDIAISYSEFGQSIGFYHPNILYFEFDSYITDEFILLDKLYFDERTMGADFWFGPNDPYYIDIKKNKL